MSRFLCHSSFWGHGAHFCIAAYLEESQQSFVADFTTYPCTRHVVIWLRGGTSYRYRSNHPVTVDAAATAKSDPNCGTSFAVKTSVNANMKVRPLISHWSKSGSELTTTDQLNVANFSKSLGLAVNDGTNSGNKRGLWVWSPTDSNHVIYSSNPSGTSPAGNSAVAGHWDSGHRMRFRTATGQGFLWENNGEQRLMDLDSDTGNLWVKGDLEANHTGTFDGRPKVRSFKMGGSTSSFYPVKFGDKGWNDGVLHLEISRASVHADGSWQGALMSKLLCHSSSWGHGANMCYADYLAESQKNFIADYTTYPCTSDVAVWLRGGYTYWYRSNHPVTVDYSATAKSDPNCGTSFPVKTSVNSGKTVKSFVIDHPLDDDRHLVHGALEGPEGAVYYRGSAKLSAGRAVVELPHYFEALTLEEGRTIQLTNVDGFDRLAVKTQDGRRIFDGRFVVVAEDPRSEQAFDWQVMAVRADVDELVVEPLRADVDVRAFGEGELEVLAHRGALDAGAVFEREIAADAGDVEVERLVDLELELELSRPEVVANLGVARRQGQLEGRPPRARGAAPVGDADELLGDAVGVEGDAERARLDGGRDEHVRVVPREEVEGLRERIPVVDEAGILRFAEPVGRGEEVLDRVLGSVDLAGGAVPGRLDEGLRGAVEQVAPRVSGHAVGEQVAEERAAEGRRRHVESDGGQHRVVGPVVEVRGVEQALDGPDRGPDGDVAEVVGGLGDEGRRLAPHQRRVGERPGPAEGEGLAERELIGQ